MYKFRGRKVIHFLKLNFYFSLLGLLLEKEVDVYGKYVKIVELALLLTNRFPVQMIALLLLQDYQIKSKWPSIFYNKGIYFYNYPYFYKVCALM